MNTAPSTINYAQPEFVELALKAADLCIEHMQRTIDLCHARFELVVGNKILRFNQPPAELSEARARMLCARRYVAAIDPSNQSETNRHRAYRAVVVSQLLLASIQALMARALVELARKQPVCKEFSTQATYALFYAEKTLGEDWQYCVPKILHQEDQELPEQERQYAVMLGKYGQTAWDSAQKLTHQIEALSLLPPVARDKLLVKTPPEILPYDADKFNPEPKLYDLPRVSTNI